MRRKVDTWTLASAGWINTSSAAARVCATRAAAARNASTATPSSRMHMRASSSPARHGAACVKASAPVAMQVSHPGPAPYPSRHPNCLRGCHHAPRLRRPDHTPHAHPSAVRGSNSPPVRYVRQSLMPCCNASSLATRTKSSSYRCSPLSPASCEMRSLTALKPWMSMLM